jgi:hypothetical protein
MYSNTPRKLRATLARSLATVALACVATATAFGPGHVAHAGPIVTTPSRIRPTTEIGAQTVGIQWINAAQPWSQFAQTADTYFNEGLRAVSIATALDPTGQVLYSAIFHSGQGTDAQWINTAAPWASFAQTVDTYFNQGLRLVSISTVTGSDGQILYTGVFRGGQGDGAQWVSRAEDHIDFFRTVANQESLGLQLIATATAIGSDGNLVYTGLFRNGPGNDGQTHEASLFWSGFADHTDYERSQGFRLIAIASTLGPDGWVEYDGVYRQSAGTEWVHAAQPWASFAATDAAYFNQGLRMVALALTTDANGQVLYTGVWETI